MTRFNAIKTSFFDANSQANREQARSIPTEVKARVNSIYKSSNPKDNNLFFIKASIISVREEKSLTIEPVVKGSGDQVPEAEFLLNNLTNITLIPQTEGLPQPFPGDEIAVELVVSEVTKNLNVDGYYKRIIKKTEGPRTDSANDKTQKLKDNFGGTNSLTQQDTQQQEEYVDEGDIPPGQQLREAKKRNSNINSLNEETKQKILLFIKRLEQENLPFIVHEARRTQLRQKFLYAQGRNTSELVKKGVTEFEGRPEMKKITWTLNSNHKNGDAVDVILNFDHPYWKGKRKPLAEGPWMNEGPYRSLWLQMRRVAKEVGLFYFGDDWPHISSKPG